MCIHADRVWERVSVCACEHSLLLCATVCTSGQRYKSSVCVRVGSVSDRVGVYTCGQSFGSCECVYV